MQKPQGQEVVGRDPLGQQLPGTLLPVFIQYRGVHQPGRPKTVHGHLTGITESAHLELFQKRVIKGTRLDLNTQQGYQD